jgi:hypothetical protein
VLVPAALLLPPASLEVVPAPACSARFTKAAAATHDGEDLRALRVKLGERAGEDFQGGGHVLHRDGSAASASVQAANALLRLRQCLQLARPGRQLHVSPNEM